MKQAVILGENNPNHKNSCETKNQKQETNRYFQHLIPFGIRVYSVVYDLRSSHRTQVPSRSNVTFQLETDLTRRA